MKELNLELLSDQDFIDFTKELTRIAVESIWETRHLYGFYLTSIPEVRLRRLEGVAYFLPKNLILIDEDLENPLFTLLHETGHFIRYNKAPEKWDIQKTRGVEEIIADLHAIQFTDSRGVLDYCMKIELTESEEKESTLKTATKLYKQNPNILSTLVKMNYEQATEHIERIIGEKGLVERLRNLFNSIKGKE